MAWIVIVPEKKNGGTILRRIKTDVERKENAITQAKERNPEGGLEWDEATVEDADS